MSEILRFMEHTPLLMSLVSYFLPLSALFIVLNLLQALFTTPISQKHLPPSPKGLPIIGNLHQIGRYPHRSLQALAKRYGPVMLLHLGSNRSLVVSSPQSAQDIMETYDLKFANRPSVNLASKFVYDNKDIILARYSPYWRSMKSMCRVHVFSSKRVEPYRSVREEETSLMLKEIESRWSSCPSSPIDLSEAIESLTMNVICRTTIGRKHCEGENGKKMQNLLKKTGEVLGDRGVSNFFPWLAWVDHVTGRHKRADKIFNELDGFLSNVLDDHMANASASAAAKKNGMVDIIDVLLETQKSGSSGLAIDRDSIKAIIFDIFAGGNYAPQTLLQWAMVELLKNPKVMKEAQREIRCIIGSKASVAEDDVGKMRYLKAVIKETLRLHPAFPLISRESSEDTKVQGYEVPAKTGVIFNLWAIGRDPTAWEQPEEFKPERFLDGPIDFRGSNFQYIPFGGGSRMCLGIKYATALMEMALAGLLLKFNWKLPEGTEIDAESTGELILHPKFHVLAIASPHFS